MPNVRTLSVSLVARSKGFTRGMTAAQRSLSTFTTGLARGVTAIAKYGAALSAAGAAAGAFFVRQQFAAVDALAKTSDKLGLTTESLAGLRHAADLTGVATSQLETGIQRMTRRIAEAAVGTGEAQGALRELGIDARRLVQLAPDEQFAAVADAMRRVTNQNDQLRLTFKLFDSEGVALVNLLREGSTGLAAMEKEAKRLGLALNRVEAKQIEQANDAMTRLRAAFQGAFRTLAVQFAPFIEGAIDKIVEFGTQGEGAAVKIAGAFESTLTFIAKAVNLVNALKAAFKLTLAVVVDIGAAILEFNADAAKGIALLAQHLPGRFGRDATSSLIASSEASRGAAVRARVTSRKLTRSAEQDLVKFQSRELEKSVTSGIESLRKTATDAAQKALATRELTLTERIAGSLRGTILNPLRRFAEVGRNLDTQRIALPQQQPRTLAQLTSGVGALSAQDARKTQQNIRDNTSKAVEVLEKIFERLRGEPTPEF